MSIIDTSIAASDALGRMKVQAERDRATIAGLRERIEALVNENLAKSKEIAALRRRKAQEETTEIIRKKKK